MWLYHRRVLRADRKVQLKKSGQLSQPMLPSDSCAIVQIQALVC